MISHFVRSVRRNVEALSVE